jgi:hypothetical protein
MLDLCERANELGAASSPDRWRTIKSRDVERWAQYGLLPDVPRPGIGRGRGRKPIYSDEFTRRLVEVAILVRQEHSQARAALALFARGRAPNEEVIRKAYREELDRLEGSINKAAARGQQNVAGVDRHSELPHELSPEDRADLAEPMIAGYLKRLALGDKTHRQATANLFSRVMLHGDVDRVSVAETLIGLGVPDWLAIGGDNEPDVGQVFGQLSLEDLRTTAESSPIQELEEALAMAQALVADLVRVASEHIPELEGAPAMQLIENRSDVAPALDALGIAAVRRATFNSVTVNRAIR